jgi:hypothetical protein
MSDERTAEAVAFLRSRGYVVADPVPGDMCECRDSEGIHHKTRNGRITYCTRLRCGCVVFRPRKTASGGAA